MLEIEAEGYKGSEQFLDSVARDGVKAWSYGPHNTRSSKGPIPAEGLPRYYHYPRTPSGGASQPTRPVDVPPWKPEPEKVVYGEWAAWDMRA
jgi:hypothetical protein